MLVHRFLILTFISGLSLTLQCNLAGAYDKRLRPQFDRLEYDTRLEEVCGTEVGLAINREHPEFSVNKVVADTFIQSKHEGNKITAPGAAFRSRGKWYRLRFDCETGPHHMDMHKMSYAVGSEVPRSKWVQYYLYD